MWEAAAARCRRTGARRSSTSSAPARPPAHSTCNAVGCAEAGRRLHPASDEITLVTSGEGATSEGEFWEALNAACLERLPVVFLVEDNGYRHLGSRREADRRRQYRRAGGARSRACTWKKWTARISPLPWRPCGGGGLVPRAPWPSPGSRRGHPPLFPFAFRRRAAVKTQAERAAEAARDPHPQGAFPLTQSFSCANTVMFNSHTRQITQYTPYIDI